MVEHMVWIKFKPGVSRERQQVHLDGLRSLKGKVPGVTALKLGENFSERSGGYTHALMVTFPDRAALAVYGPHPEHMKVARPLREDADLLVVDIEV